MTSFLQRFRGLILGVLCGFDRLIFRGRLCPFYSPDGMNIYLSANGILRKDFEKHVAAVSDQVMQSPLVQQARAAGRFVYLPSTNTNKDRVARDLARTNRVTEGLTAVLQCVEPCWSFGLESHDRVLTVRGKPRKCSHLYHYFLDPQLGWMFVRLQTWFPFEIQVYVNGREWLTRQMDHQGLRYRRSDNKIVWLEDWDRGQHLLDKQLQTSWPTLLDELQRRVHPLHPAVLGKLAHVHYNWTVFQSEWATDVAFRDRAELLKWMRLWQRQALAYPSTTILRFLGRTGQLQGNYDWDVETEYRSFYEGMRIKHWVDRNALKLYDHLNVGRVELTINDIEFFKVYRASQADPDGPLDWRSMRRSVADPYRRAEVSQGVNDRYLASMATVQETRTVKELVAPLCEPAPEPVKKSRVPGTKPVRRVRALNPWSADDAALLTAIADPKWMVRGLRNRDVVALLYPQESPDPTERRRRSARVTRLLRILRGHGLLQKVPKTHRYQVNETARAAISALLAAANANPAELLGKAA